jgi:hypothetical protein
VNVIALNGCQAGDVVNYIEFQIANTEGGRTYIGMKVLVFETEIEGDPHEYGTARRSRKRGGA